VRGTRKGGDEEKLSVEVDVKRIGGQQQQQSQ
jgi:hypothetical protein